MEKLLTQKDAVNQSVVDFASRGPRDELKPDTLYFCTAAASYCRLSYRQIHRVIIELGRSCTAFSQMKAPSRGTIGKIILATTLINIHQMVEFLKQSRTIAISVDASTKKTRPIFAVILTNNEGATLALPGVSCPDGTVETESNAVLEIIKRSSNTAEQYGFIDDAESFTKHQFGKIVSVLSDSCNTAVLTRQLLASKIKEESGRTDQYIASLDCIMHCVKNSESKSRKTPFLIVYNFKV
mgnify:CR=1 FL=1